MHHAAAGQTTWHFSVGTLLSEAAQNLTEGARVGSFASSPRRAAPVPVPPAPPLVDGLRCIALRSLETAGGSWGGRVLLAHESSLALL